MKNTKTLVLFLFIIILGIACSKSADGVTAGDSDDDSSAGVQTEQTGDYDWTTTTSNDITLNGTSISTTSANVTISGTIATITKGGQYTISGTLTNGQIKVDADTATVKIKLNGATIANSSTSPFYIKKSKKTIIFVADGTTNSISDATTYSNTDEPNACIFSNTYLAFTGTGALTVKGNYNDAISSDDQIVINNGTITVTAKDDGIRGKDYLKVNGGTLKVTAGTGHALKSDNDTDKGYGFVEINGGTVNLASTSADGIHAVKRVIINDGNVSIAASASQGLRSDSLVLVNGGITNITASREGAESPNITIAKGTINITASDDGLNATKGTGGESNDGSMLAITGGNLSINAVGGDGLDSNGNISMTGGTAVVHGPRSQPEVGLDYNGTFTMKGGFLVISGIYSQMTQGISTSSSQYGLKITSSSSLSTSTLIHIQDASGNDLVTFQPLRAYTSIIFSSPALLSGTNYSIYTGGTSTGTVSNGLYSSGIYSGGTLKKTISLSSAVTTVSL
jgi:hypothetical protein